MGIDTQIFQVILDASFKHRWNSTAIPCTDTNINGEPRLGAHSLNAAGGLGFYLHYLQSSMREVGLQLIFALIPSTINHYLTFTHQTLLHTLKEYSASRFTWLDDNRLDEMSSLIQVTGSTIPDQFANLLYLQA